jgi:AcrR family transcriptional regulator
MIRDMTTARSRRNEATRAEILQSFLDLAHQENAVTISVPAVAEAAGVSVRTVYRYFPTKDILQTEAAKAWASRVREQSVGAEVTVANFAHFLRELWTDFGADHAAVWAEHATPIGRALRRERLDGSRRMVRQAVRAGNGDEAMDDDLVDLTVAVSSSSMYLELVDRMGHDPQHAADMVVRLIEIMLDHQGIDRPTTESGSTKATEAS